MIKDYEIRNKNGEEVLYLYLDFDTEFAKLGKKEKNKKFGEIVRDFLKKNDIKFDGQKIAIISGGLLVATLMMKAPAVKEYDTAAIPQDSIVLVDENLAILPEFEAEDSEDIQDVQDVKQENSDGEQTTGTQTNGSTNSANKTSANTANKNTTSSANTSAGSTSSSTSSSQASKPATAPSTATPPKVESAPSVVEPTPITPESQGVYVTVNRSNGTVVRLELEEYVVGVVGAEMPASFNKEALKAQAVIARTYALKALETGKVLTDTSSTQNYKDETQLRAMWGSSFQTYYQKIRSAVAETKGMYATYNSVIIDAVYHSTSNGRTEDAKYVWGNAFPYLVSVSSPYDSSNSSFRYEYFLTYEQISSKLGISVDSETDIQILSKTSGDRVDSISIGSALYTGVTVRNKLGLRSADFDIVRSDYGITFVTRGYGHGVGLSQYGANGMANNGYDYASILKHYYQGISISHL